PGDWIARDLRHPHHRHGRASPEPCRAQVREQGGRGRARGHRDGQPAPEHRGRGGKPRFRAGPAMSVSTPKRTGPASAWLPSAGPAVGRIAGAWFLALGLVFAALGLGPLQFLAVGAVTIALGHYEGQALRTWQVWAWSVAAVLRWGFQIEP